MYIKVNGEWKPITLGAVDGTPLGTILINTTETIPDGYLECNGQAVSRTTYKDLFSIIGTTYGVGDGSTTFNVPDMKGRVVAGLEENLEYFDEIGKKGGETTHTLTIDEMPSDVGILNEKSGDFPKATLSSTSGWGYNANRELSSSNNQPHNILQPYITQIYIIKATKTIVNVSEVENDLSSDSTTNVPSVHAVKEEINNIKDIFSTDEIKTNKVWIDGKPIYRKVVDIGQLPSKAMKNIDINLQNVDMITSFKGIAYRSSDNRQLTLPNADEPEYTIGMWVTPEKITIQTYISSMDQYKKAYATIEYTKTTD